MNYYRPKVYTASKLAHAEMWRSLRADPLWDHVEWTARWPDMAHLESSPAAAAALEDTDFTHFWTIDVQDVTRSDFVLLYGEERPDYPLRGAIFEAGVAVASLKTVLAIGLDQRHTWRCHPLVCCLDTLEEARKLLLRYCTIPPARIIP